MLQMLILAGDSFPSRLARLSKGSCAQRASRATIDIAVLVYSGVCMRINRPSSSRHQRCECEYLFPVEIRSAINLAVAQAKFLVALALVSSAFAEPSGSIYTLDKHIVREEIATVRFSPSGEVLVYEHVPPYDTLGDYGANYNIRPRFGAHIYFVERNNPSSPRMLFSQRQGMGCWIGDFSPSGNRLAYYCLEQGQVTAGIYDFESEENQRFDFTPYFSDWRLSSSPIWLSDDRLLYVALPPGSQPYEVVQRRHAGNQIDTRRQQAWLGKLSVTVLKSGTQLNKSVPLEGELLLVDLAADTVDSIADGLFVDLVVSQSSGRIAAFRQWTAVQPDPDRPVVGYHLGRLEPVVIDIHSRSVTPMCQACGGVSRTITWSDDGNSVVFFGHSVFESVTAGRYAVFELDSRGVTQFEHRGLSLSPKRGREFYHEPEKAYLVNGKLLVYARRLANENAQPAFYTSSTVVDGLATDSEWHVLDRNGSSTTLTAKSTPSSPIVLATHERGLTLLLNGKIVRVSTGGVIQSVGVAKGNLTLPYRSYNAWQDRPTPKPEQILISDDLGEGVVFVNLADDSMHSLALPSETSQVLAATSTGRAAAVLHVGANNLTSLSLVTANIKVSNVVSINEHLVGIKDPTWTSRTYKFKAEELTSCALLPPDYDKNRKYPTIVSVYPGVSPGCTSQAYRNANRIGTRMQGMGLHLLASQGYVVIRPTIPYVLMHGPDGPMEHLTDLVNAATDVFVNEGISKSDQLGLYGFSNGGVAALWVLTQTDRFKTAVVGHSWVNATSHYGNNGRHVILSDFPEFDRHSSSVNQYEQHDSWPYAMGGTLWTHANKYVKNSPLFIADRIDVPLLIYHSDLDSGFPRGEFDQLFTALYRLGKDAEYLHYWGEGHGPNSPENIVHLWERIFDWYGVFLGARSRIALDQGSTMH